LGELDAFNVLASITRGTVVGTFASLAAKESTINGDASCAFSETGCVHLTSFTQRSFGWRWWDADEDHIATTAIDTFAGEPGRALLVA